MLDVMRQANRRKWFLYILILPVVFSFVLAIFAIWGGAADSGGGLSGTTWAARVDGLEISAREFGMLRQRVEAQFRRQFGEQLDPATINYDFDQATLGQLVGQGLAYNEAVRLGLNATDQEIGEAIRGAPVFQRDGRFIGREQYMNELRARGYDVAEYEREVARELAVSKLRDLMGSMISVTDAEAEQAFRDEGETAEVDYVLLKESDFSASSGEPSSREIEAHYNQYRSSFMTPEKRRASYIVIEREPLQRSVDVPEKDIQDYYDKNKQTLYTLPDQKRASHILFKVPDDAAPEATEAVRVRAASVLEQVKAGGDFAELAKQHSEDGSAAQGGDLGWFGAGRMVPEFERAAFALSEGQVSDLVKSPFGFHIIKLTGARPAGVRPLEEVREQIKQQVGFRSAQDLLQRKVDELRAKLDLQASSFEATAQELGYTVKDTGLVAVDDPLGDMGRVAQASEELFRLNPGETSGPVNTLQGTAFLRLADVQAPAPAPLAAVRDQVAKDLIRRRALGRARAAAGEIAAAGTSGFKEAADKKKLEVQSTAEFSRSTAPATFTDPIKEAVFSHAAGDIVGPLDASDGVVLIRIIKRGPSPDQIAGIKRGLREDRLERKRREAFDALLQRLQRASVIEYNQAFLEEVGRRRTS